MTDKPNLRERIASFEKPVSVITEWIRQRSGVGDLVLDTFMGAGATMPSAAFHRNEPQKQET